MTLLFNRDPYNTAPPCPSWMGPPEERELAGGHTAVRADALEHLRSLEDGRFPLVFVDPPYNIGKEFVNGSDRQEEATYLAWVREWFGELLRVMAPNGSIYLMGATQFMPHIDLMMQEKLHVLNRIVWTYDSSGVQAKTRFGSNYEPIMFAVKDAKNYTFNLDDVKVKARTGADRKLIDYRKNPPQPYSNLKNPGNVWYFPRVRFRMPEYQEHPSQKPELLLERIIKASSNEGAEILDPFAGVFTTATVAGKLGRRSYSIEIDPDFFEAGCERLRGIRAGSAIGNSHNNGRTPQAMQAPLLG